MISGTTAIILLMGIGLKCFQLSHQFVDYRRRFGALLACCLLICLCIHVRDAKPTVAKTESKPDQIVVLADD